MFVAASRVRALAFEAPADASRVVRAFRGASRAQMELVRGQLGRALCAPLLVSEPEASVRSVAVEEALVDARERARSGLAWLRIGGMASSFLGFAGAALELRWIYSGDHGLLGLDPTRVAAAGMNGAALAIAIGVAGSSFALGAWMTLGTLVRELERDCLLVAERVHAWSGASRAEHPVNEGHR